MNKETSIPSIIILSSPDSPMQLKLPNVKENETYYISLTNPDLSLLSEDNIYLLNQILYSEEYLSNPMYDEIREKCANKNM